MSTATRNTGLAHRPGPTATEETALSTREEHSRELSTAREAAMAQHELQSAITVAIKFPRNEDEAFGRLMKSAKRLTFAEKAVYSFPRGGSTVSGPSAHLAREAARVWGNVRYGFEIVRDDDENIHLRGWAWDMQTNTKVTQDAHFKKLVYRKKGGWQKPDERDLRELVNKHGAIAERNCILKVVPSDLVEDAQQESVKTMRAGVAKDIDGERKKIIMAFAELNVAVADIEKYLGNPLKQATAEQVAELRTVYKSIIDGNSRWVDYAQGGDEKPTPTAPQEATMDDLTGDGAMQAPEEPEFTHAVPDDSPGLAGTENLCASILEKLTEKLDAETSTINVGKIVADTLANVPQDAPAGFSDSIIKLGNDRIAAIKAGRGEGSNKQKDMLG